MICICMDFHWTCFYCAYLCQFLVPLNTCTKKLPIQAELWLKKLLKIHGPQKSMAWSA